MNQFFTSKIDFVKQSFPSVFTKEDVVKIIEDLYFDVSSIIDSQTKTEMTADDMRDLADAISSSLSGSGSDILRDYDLVINYGREVEIDDFTLNENMMSDVAFREIKSFFNNKK